MRSYKNFRIDGYMTVEAALVIPSAIFGIVLIIYMAFWVYGRCILSQDTYLLGFRASLFYEEKGYGNAGEYVNEHLDEQMVKNYFGSRKPKISANQSNKEIIMDGNIITNHNALYGFFKGIPDLWKSEAKATIKIQKPAKTLRKIKRIKDVAANLSKKKKDQEAD
ncbi:TadE family protein [Butyrivibrio sp. AE3004]|uniref:TadE family protein n=1 Tax=Butyrivibrio sp. AE3004 TaxID=1506994 RepID=UPI000494293B|nr:TadE family protein [Butyrivibrio sp. AE3004]